MGQREANALWLLPLAYVVAYRLLAQLAWRAIIATGERAAMNQAMGLVVAVVCAAAAACLCVYVHARIVGPVPLERSLLMAAIAMPMLLAGHVLTGGFANLTRYWSLAPVQAAINYGLVFLALPFAAAIVGAGGARGAVAAGEALPRVASPLLIVLRLFVALVSVGAFCAGALFMVVVAGFGGLRLAGPDGAFVWALIVALALFAFCFLCAIGRLRAARHAAPIIVAVAAMVYIGWLLTQGGAGVWASGAIALFAVAFWRMCRGMEARA